jgi:hypothetical protein
MTKEEDDLYADLYSEDVGGDKSGSQGQEDSLYEEEIKPKGMLNKGASNAAPASTSRSSFIPAAKPSSSFGSSFIPADPGKSTSNSTSTTTNSSSNNNSNNNQISSQRSFLPPTPIGNAAPTSRIETAPMTNLDGDNNSSSNNHTGDQSYKQLLPHEMPDEG